jgi:hypothetical protein
MNPDLNVSSFLIFFNREVLQHKGKCVPVLNQARRHKYDLLHPFLASALYLGMWLVSPPGRFTPTTNRHIALEGC